MNKPILITVLVLFFGLDSFCQQEVKFKDPEPPKEDSIPVESVLLQVPVYALKSCLQTLCADVESSNRSFYGEEASFYSVSFYIGEKCDFLAIQPKWWCCVDDFHYKGALKINGRTFLLRGDIQYCALFQKQEDLFFIHKLKLDTVDLWSKTFIQEPILQGGYQECTGRLLSIEVYAKAPIKGYQMRFPGRGKR